MVGTLTEVILMVGTLTGVGPPTATGSLSMLDLSQRTEAAPKRQLSWLAAPDGARFSTSIVSVA